MNQPKLITVRLQMAQNPDIEPGPSEEPHDATSVFYTHLTLPTIPLV